MNAIKFMKYDLRRSKTILLLSIILFAPLSLMMAYNSESVFGVFSYMALVSIIGPATLFTYEQKTDCGFENMFPATDLERVTGRYLAGVVYIIYELLIAFIVSAVLCKISSMRITNVFVIILFFVAIPLIYMALLNTLFWALGRKMNQQVKSLMVMFPAIVVWVGVNVIISILEYNDVTGILLYVMNHLKLIGIIAVAVGIVFYIAGILICTQIVKKSDYR